MLSWLSYPAAPSWVQAVGSVVAIFVAVFVPWHQRRNALHDATATHSREQKDHLQRLTVGLKEEIRAASDAAERRQIAISETLKQLRRDQEKGATLQATGPINAGSLSLTDGIVYKQVAAELGRLPPDLIKSVVAFYSLVIDVGRIADSAPIALEAYQTIYPSLPRVRTYAAILVRTLEKFEEANFAPNAQIRPSSAEIRKMAADTGYPLDEVAAERGIAVPS